MGGGKMNWDRHRPFSVAGERADKARFYGDDRGHKYAALSEYQEKLRVIVDGAKARPCKDCGVQYPSYVMQFDHLDERTKEFNISQYRVLTPSAEVLEREIAKCEVVCANCHAERTHQRKEAVRAAQEKYQRERAREGLPPK